MPRSKVKVWKPVPNYPGYEVSSDGEIRSWKRPRHNGGLPKEPRIMSPSITPNGYRQVNAYINGKGKPLRIRQVVAEVFCGPRPPGAVTRHLNGIKTDDRACNLKWGTWQDNSNDAKRHGTWLHGEPVHTSKLTEKQVKYIIRSKLSPTELAKKYGVTCSNICHILKGRSWRHLTGLKAYE